MTMSNADYAALLEHVPTAVASIVTTMAPRMTSNEVTADAIEKRLLALTERLTKTMVKALLEGDHT